MTPLSPERVMATVRELPALPAVVLELIDLLGHEDVAADQLASKIMNDQALTAKTLRLANSSFYGMPRKVSRVSDAISVLGLRTVRSVVTAAAVTGSFAPPRCEGFDFVAFWRHAIATAVCARLLAVHMKIDPEAAFTAGLLHDLGHLVLASCFAPEFAQVLAHQSEHDMPAVEVEQALLGMSHTAVGGLMAEHWRFSPDVVQAIRQHHAPEAPGAGVRLCSLVHVADNMAHALDLAHVEGDAVPEMCTAAWMQVALDGPTCRRVLEQTETQAEAVCEVLI